MHLEALLFDSAIVVFTFYIISCIVRTTVKTCCLISLVRSLESISTDFIKNKLPDLLKQSQNPSSHTCCGCCAKDDVCAHSIDHIHDLYEKTPSLKD